MLDGCFATLWTVSHKAPLSMRFPRQEYWSGLPFPSPGNLPHPRSELTSPALAAVFFTTELPRKPLEIIMCWATCVKLLALNMIIWISLISHTISFCSHSAFDIFAWSTQVWNIFIIFIKSNEIKAKITLERSSEKQYNLIGDRNLMCRKKLLGSPYTYPQLLLLLLSRFSRVRLYVTS